MSQTDGPDGDTTTRPDSLRKSGFGAVPNARTDGRVPQHSPRPEVRCNAAMSADGKVNVPGGGGRFASAYDRRRMDWWRAQADAVVVGAGTVRSDDPIMQIRCPEALAHRSKLGALTPQPWTVVVMGREGMAADARLLRAGSGPVVLVGCQARPPTIVGGAPAGVSCWQAGTHQVEPLVLLGQLAQAGVRRVLIEGGGKTLWHFIAAGVVDQICLTVVPRLLAGAQAPSWLSGSSWPLATAPRLRLVSCQPVGNEIFVRWQVLGAGDAAAMPGPPAG